MSIIFGFKTETRSNVTCPILHLLAISRSATELVTKCKVEVHGMLFLPNRRIPNILEINGPNMLAFETNCHAGGVTLDFLRGKGTYDPVQYEVRIQFGYRPRVFLRPCRCDRYINVAYLSKIFVIYFS